MTTALETGCVPGDTPWNTKEPESERRLLLFKWVKAVVVVVVLWTINHVRPVILSVGDDWGSPPPIFLLLQLYRFEWSVVVVLSGCQELIRGVVAADKTVGSCCY